MGPEAPAPVVIPVQCAPQKAPCPQCGKRGRRKRTLARTVAYKTIAFLEINDQDHMRRFLKNLKTLKTRGLMPRMVVTDGSNLYPAVLAELWPDADYQLCVFSRHQGHQQADPRRSQADADIDETARQNRAQEEAGP